MSYQSLSEKLAILEESNAQLKDLVERLATIKFQPGSVPLNNEDGDILEELSGEIQQTIRDQDDDFELLLEEVKDLDGGRPGSELEQQKLGLEQSVNRALKELKASQSSFRKAQHIARETLKAAKRAERELLLQSYLEPRSATSSPGPSNQPRRRVPPRINSPSVDDKTVNASSDVTLALRRTHDLMANELSRSQFAHDTLKESTAALAQLNETYSTLDTLLSSSRNLLGTLLRSQKSDTWYLESAFYVLLCTIAWLVFRRFFYGPLWWFLWFPMKMFVKGWVGVFAAMGLGADGQKDGLGNVSSVAKSVLQGGVSTGGRATVTMSGTEAPSMSVGGDADAPRMSRNVDKEAESQPSGESVGGDADAPRMSRNVDKEAESQPSGESVSEEVDKIIEEGRRNPPGGEVVSEETVTEPEPEPEPEPDAEVASNPKKRMWEEPVEAAKGEHRKRDEL